jgi:hypothetical protein
LNTPPGEEIIIFKSLEDKWEPKKEKESGFRALSNIFSMISDRNMSQRILRVKSGTSEGHTKILAKLLFFLEERHIAPNWPSF